jgi:hypothetical protein
VRANSTSVFASVECADNVQEGGRGKEGAPAVATATLCIEEEKDLLPRNVRGRR